MRITCIQLEYYFWKLETLGKGYYKSHFSFFTQQEFLSIDLMLLKLSFRLILELNIYFSTLMISRILIYDLRLLRILRVIKC